MSCPREELTALVDGALGHDARDRVHAHLAGCSTCRAEVEAERALKARLGRLSGAAPAPSAELLERLRGFAVPGVEPTIGRRSPLPVGAAGTAPQVSRPVDRRPAPRPSAGPRRARRVRRTGTVGGGLLLLGVGLALALGGQPAPSPPTPVDPGSDAFVVDFVSTTGGVPLADPAERAALLPQP